ncbi:MAG: cell division FtsA domain-containing protein [Candidatus Dormibacteraceae bacterium]
MTTSRFRFLRRKDDYFKHFTVLDIGTEVAKVLVGRREGDEGTVLGVGREAEPRGAISGGAIDDVEAVIRSCNKALEAAEDMAGVVPGQVVVGIGGELAKGFSSSISYPRERPDAKVKEAELKSLLQLVQKRALREAQQLLELERAYGQLEARLVHAAITGVKMDGYPLTTPLGFEGRNLELTVFNMFAPKTQVEAMETVLRELDLELLTVVATPYALARACATEEIWEHGGIYLDIGGSTTEVALLRGGGIEGIRMFNVGGRSITRRLAAVSDLTLEEAEARKLRYTEGLLPVGQADPVRRLVAVDVEVLLQGLNLSLRELADGEALPSTVYVAGGGSLLPEVVILLRQGDWAEGLPFPRRPAIRHLVPDDVGGVVDSTGQLKRASDMAPMALANYALTAAAEAEDPVQAVLREVLRELKI